MEVISFVWYIQDVETGEFLHLDMMGVYDPHQCWGPFDWRSGLPNINQIRHNDYRTYLADLIRKYPTWFTHNDRPRFTKLVEVAIPHENYAQDLMQKYP